MSRVIRDLSYVATYEVVATFPHEHDAFTQGLAFSKDGTLYESDGLFGKSAVRMVDVSSGTSSIRTLDPKDIFGEGIVVHNNTLLQLSWKKHTIFEYYLPSLRLRRKVPFNIGAEGWGIASDGKLLYVTDSRASVFVVEPGTYQLVKEMRIIDQKLAPIKSAIYGVNELEWVGDEIWGNVYPMYQHSHSECVVRIDGNTGQVRGWVDFTGLLAKQRIAVRVNSHNFVLNGIAYHEQSHRLYVTGKQWDHMYQVRVKSAPHLGAPHVLSQCNLG